MVYKVLVQKISIIYSFSLTIYKGFLSAFGVYFTACLNLVFTVLLSALSTYITFDVTSKGYHRYSSLHFHFQLLVIRFVYYRVSINLYRIYSGSIARESALKDNVHYLEVEIKGI